VAGAPQAHFCGPSRQPISDKCEVQTKQHGPCGCRKSQQDQGRCGLGPPEPQPLPPRRARRQSLPQPAEADGGETRDDNDDDNDKEDKDKDEDKNEDVEERSAREVQEFYNLLKKTAPEDVRRIDARLHDQISGRAAPLEGWESKMMEKVWEMASRLTSVGEVAVRVGKKLQNLGAFQSPWGRCVGATEIAGELLCEVMEKARAEAKVECQRPQHHPCMVAGAATVVALQEDSVSYFAKRLAPLVDDTGCTHAEKTDSRGAALVTFFNKEMQQVYINLTLQIKASNALAKHSSQVAFELDREVKVGTATMEDSWTRFETAVEVTHSLYPLVEGSGKLFGCELPNY